MEPVQPFHMHPMFDVLLRGDEQVPVGLYHLQLATAAQLCRLHYSPNSIKLVKKRLRVLMTHGFVQAEATYTQKGNGAYYYMLGTHGIAYLEEVGYDVRETLGAKREIAKGHNFLEHTLDVNDLLIAAALVGKEGTPYSLGSFTHERLLKRNPYVARWQHQKFTLIPDALLDFRYATSSGQTLSMPVLLEHDRATEEREHFKRRIRAYIALLSDEAARVELFDTAAVSAVAFTTFAGDKRREKMRYWTAQELKATNASLEIGRTFRFVSLEKPVTPRAWLDAHWLDPYEDEPPQQLMAA